MGEGGGFAGRGGRRLLRLQDGRSVSLREFGVAEGRVVIALHGTPGSGLKFLSGHRDAARLGLRIICPDRWGYGLSVSPQQPRLQDYGDDAGQIADALGIGRFSVLGVSGGGPFAVAVAARLGHRVERLALVGPVGGVGESGGSAGVGLFHRFSFLVLPRIPGAIRSVFAVYRLLVLVSPHAAVRVAVARAGGHDRSLMARSEYRSPLAASFREGLARGAGGPAIDMALFSRPWELPAALKCPVRVWQGLKDRNVPISAATRLAEHLGAELTLIPEAGHYWMAADCKPVLSWLASGGCCNADLSVR